MRTCLEKYSVQHPMQSDEIRKRAMQTCLKNHQVPYPHQSESVREKYMQTCLKRYSVKNPMHSEEIRKKQVQSCLNNHQVAHPMQSENIREKSRQTCLKKYGFQYPMQCPEIAEKQMKMSLRRKPKIIPSGEIFYLQGYEPQCVDLLLKDYDEEDLMLGAEQVPEVWWIDDDGKRHRYYMDIYIPKDNLGIEVKSMYTLTCNPKVIQKKLDAARNTGCRIELWVFDEKELLYKLDNVM